MNQLIKRSKSDSGNNIRCELMPRLRKLMSLPLNLDLTFSGGEATASVNTSMQYKLLISVSGANIYKCMRYPGPRT